MKSARGARRLREMLSAGPLERDQEEEPTRTSPNAQWSSADYALPHRGERPRLLCTCVMDVSWSGLRGSGAGRRLGDRSGPSITTTTTTADRVYPTEYAPTIRLPSRSAYLYHPAVTSHDLSRARLTRFAQPYKYPLYDGIPWTP